MVEIVKRTCEEFGLRTHKDKQLVSGVNDHIVSLGVEICVLQGKLIVRPRGDKSTF